MPTRMICQHCGGKMVKAFRVDRHVELLVVGVAGLIGGAMLFSGSWDPAIVREYGIALGVPLREILGVLLVIASLGLGLQGRRFWRCTKCRYEFKRK